MQKCRQKTTSAEPINRTRHLALCSKTKPIRHAGRGGKGKKGENKLRRFLNGQNDKQTGTGGMQTVISSISNEYPHPQRCFSVSSTLRHYACFASGANAHIISLCTPCVSLPLMHTSSGNHSTNGSSSGRRKALLNGGSDFSLDRLGLSCNASASRITCFTLCKRFLT